jgi:probable rRNA maturation factor
MEINISIDEKQSGCLEESFLRMVASQVLAVQGVSVVAEMELVITGQEEIAALNKKYRGQDRPTDVLAFSLRPDEPLVSSGIPEAVPFVLPADGLLRLGEVVISYPQAVVQAGERRHSPKKEVAILAIHGILHLLGYDHDEPERERDMRDREAEILREIEGEI